MNTQNELFQAQARDTSELRAPGFNYTQSHLEMFKKQVVSWRPNCDEHREPEYATVYIIPVEPPIHVFAQDGEADIGITINRWLKETANDPKTESGRNWIHENASELNYSRRYWAAKQAAFDLMDAKSRLEEMTLRVELAKVNKEIRIQEAIANRAFSLDEKRVIAAEIFHPAVEIYTTK